MTCLLEFLPAISQTYNTDSSIIIIKSKIKFSVNKYEDLNIEVDFLAKAKNGIECYFDFDSRYRSNFGNCYFEIYKLDRDTSFLNITQSFLAPNHPPKVFKNMEEILKYDLPKTKIEFGKSKSLIFNILDFVSSLSKGKYSLIFYLRVSNNYGYDGDGKVIASSIAYLESIDMNFEVTKDQVSKTNFR
jgi:hypothetical protein